MGNRKVKNGSKPKLNPGPVTDTELLIGGGKRKRGILGQTLLEIDHTSVFNVFLAEVIIVLLFQQQYTPEMNQ